MYAQVVWFYRGGCTRNYLWGYENNTLARETANEKDCNKWIVGYNSARCSVFMIKADETRSSIPLIPTVLCVWYLLWFCYFGVEFELLWCNTAHVSLTSFTLLMICRRYSREDIDTYLMKKTGLWSTRFSSQPRITVERLQIGDRYIAQIPYLIPISWSVPLHAFPILNSAIGLGRS